MDSQVPNTPIRFSVKPYKADGARSASGFLLLGAICLVGSIGLGWLQEFLRTHDFDVFIFTPILLGIAIGGLSYAGVKISKVTNHFAFGFLAFISGCLVFLVSHYIGYLEFNNFRAAIPQAFLDVARNFTSFQQTKDEQTREVQQWIEELSKNPRLIRKLSVDSFSTFIRDRADDGLVIKHFSRGRVRSQTNHGPIALMAYWCFEVLVVTMAAFSLMKYAGSRPICSLCESWKVPFEEVLITGDVQQIKRSLESGELGAVFHAPAVAEPKLLLLSVLRCPDCTDPDEVELSLLLIVTPYRFKNRITYDKSKSSIISMVTYPSEAIGMFEKYSQSNHHNQLVNHIVAANKQEAAGLLLGFGWIVLGVAILILLIVTIYSVNQGQLASIGFLIGGIVFVCGWGLRWVGKRNSQ